MAFLICFLFVLKPFCYFAGNGREANQRKHEHVEKMSNKELEGNFYAKKTNAADKKIFQYG